jgi:hypothetical protein
VDGELGHDISIRSLLNRDRARSRLMPTQPDRFIHLKPARQLMQGLVHHDLVDDNETMDLEEA